MHVMLTVSTETDGRFICSAPKYPGIMQYGETREEAISAAKEQVKIVLMDRGVLRPETIEDTQFEVR